MLWLSTSYMVKYYMEARHSKRVIINFPAEIICRDKRYAGSIENLSPKGAYVLTAPVRDLRDFAANSLLELRFQFPSGEKLNLHCRIKWSYVTPPHGYTYSIGVEILDAPLTYLETLKAL